MAKKKSAAFEENIKAYKYLSPALISIFVLALLPMIYTIFIAFTNYNLTTANTGWGMVGLQNFKDVLVGPFKDFFFPVFGWTVVFATLSTFGCFFVGLFFAMLLSNKNMKESFIYKAFLIIPWALPGAIIVIAFQGLLNSQYGAINNILMNLHIIKEPIMWLTNAGAARFALVLINVWLGFPYMMNICLGALSAIPESYYEAANIDGANGWQKFTKITLPSISKTAYPLLISSWAFNFNNFTSAYLLTGGNPMRPNSPFAGYTDILGSAAYKMSIQFGRFDLGAVLSILIFVLVGSISFIQMKSSGQFEEVN